MMLLAALSLLAAHSVIGTQAIQAEQEVKAEQAERIRLSPPLNKAIRLNKTQTHLIGDKQVKLHLVKEIIFKPSSDDTIIGYDISVEIIDIKIEGDSKIIGLLANAYPAIGSISRYSYDNANEKLILHNADKIWASMIMSIDQIRRNAGERSQAQQLEDSKLLDSVKNIPPKSRKAILSQDMALLLSFVGKPLPQSGLDSEDMLIKVSQTHDRQNGLIKESSDFHISDMTGLVHKMTRTNQSSGDAMRKIMTEIEVKLP